MLTKKQTLFFKFLLNLSKAKKEYPTLQEIFIMSSFKSYNTIYKYLNILEDKGYLKYDEKRHQITYLKDSIEYDGVFSIPHINKDKIIKIDNNLFNPLSHYVALQISDSSLKSYGIFYQDILIIEKSKTFLNNKFVLLKNNLDYKIYKYTKKDGYHHLKNDKEELTLPNLDYVIGKVVYLIRKNF